MSETFTASSGKEYLLVDGYVKRRDPSLSLLPMLAPALVADMREFFQWERDRELGRERDPEDPNLVWYPFGDNEVRVVDETAGRSDHILKTDVWSSWLASSAERYFKLHRPRPLPTALGTIIEGNGKRSILAFPGHEFPWRNIGVIEGRNRTWVSYREVLQVVGPDWRVIHEGMKDDE